MQIEPAVSVTYLFLSISPRLFPARLLASPLSLFSSLCFYSESIRGMIGVLP